MASDIEHPVPTRRSGYRYLFTAKHHGGGSKSDSRWIVDRDTEFAVFDDADRHEIEDEDGRLYGVCREANTLQDLGTWGQQVAEFPKARPGNVWHGYPIWAVSENGPDNRRNAKLMPSKRVFGKLEAAGLITTRDRKRLLKGDHA